MSWASAPSCADQSRSVRWLPGRSEALCLLVGMLILCDAMTGATAQSAQASSKSGDDPYAAHIAEASHRFRVPQRWIRAIMHLESARDPRAVSSKGAVGLMQIMPATWAELRLRHQLGRDPYDPRDNILAGAAYLRELLDRYGSPGFLAAYNAGPGRYEASLKGRPLPAETRAYIAKLRPFWGGGDASGSLTAAHGGAVTRGIAPLFVLQSASESGSDPALGQGASIEHSAAASGGDPFAAGSRPRELFVGSGAEASVR
ncbi:MULTISPECIES: lytic transglycosylase domain-containing protein [unclassified Mesorhizobium]|uniref:lytic transglycosylase domain-containing protein n=1 Tax=unclassified Mesorhizobium TaxID=325217 RepID=UPI000FDB3B2C|nr:MULTISPECIES: lytic transglycosylase domain-containing protein [unclassified Mesorhizobium]TGQ04104.1 lytic transglycosylase domain-containing protein [Mesorhizobium sp. M2E.F.Ca.ET.219.01.1.1]TGT63298.1 lytic transglycosylase domain-containing protein [Mesorhizobium sp. M2E.F.Ca.ET.166.01.1.1]TGV96922.1 lytic transglycosylase domain-containing protein [Mesorhizobium sp. M2E.F.Ca.ET.154.01.1.1]